MRAMARSEHCRWVPSPGWRRASPNVTSTCQRRREGDQPVAPAVPARDADAAPPGRRGAEDGAERGQPGAFRPRAPVGPRPPRGRWGIELRVELRVEPEAHDAGHPRGERREELEAGGRGVGDHDQGAIRQPSVDLAEQVAAPGR